MGWFGMKDRLKSLQDFADRNSRRVNELDTELQNAREWIRRLQAELDQHKSVEHTASFAFDFKAVKVFSIERNSHDERPCTVIGYLLPTEEIKNDSVINSDKVREWYLYCSMQQHEQLVKQFREAISK